MTTQQAFSTALQHHQAGRLAEAEALYRQILGVQPQHVDALHFAGVLAHQRGDHATAIEQIQRALQLAPNNAAAHSNLGETLRCTGRLDEAVMCFFRALELGLNHAEAHANLGLVLAQLSRWDEAIAAYRSALQIKPDSPEMHNDLGMALAEKGLIDEAIAAFRRSVELGPGSAGTWNNLGVALARRGQLDEGIAAYHEALRLDPSLAGTYTNLAAALTHNGQHQEAALTYRQALKLQPDQPAAHNDIGNALRSAGYIDDAIAEYLRALAPLADDAGTRNNLANAYKDAGRLEEAMAEYRRAIEKTPDHPQAHGNLIYLLHFHPGAGEQVLLDEQRRWNERVSAPARRFIRPHDNDPDPDRRLRIGYVSPEFRDHVTGRYLRPLFQWHDHRSYEILCYSGVVKPDALTEEFRRRADGWRQATGLGDEELAGMIRNDRVDILVDLTQHMVGNRLQVFAREPAPVQVSFAGYPGSAGLEAIRHRISDGYLEGAADITAEQVFLVDSFWCYDPCGMELDVSSLPAADNGWVTFGCLNNFCKVNEPLLALWAKVLRQVRDSRLLFLSPFGQHRERAQAFFESHGVNRDRIQFSGLCSRREYLALHHRLDLALDPFPYNGHTTSMDALWMGVPVVSRAGRSAVSRAGLSQLSNVDLPELACFSEEDFVYIAVGLASDLPRLAELRRTLRARMTSSPLMDGERFARGIEAAYRSMWRTWCASPNRSGE